MQDWRQSLSLHSRHTHLRCVFKMLVCFASHILTAAEHLHKARHHHRVLYATATDEPMNPPNKKSNCFDVKVAALFVGKRNDMKLKNRRLVVV